MRSSRWMDPLSSRRSLFSSWHVRRQCTPSRRDRGAIQSSNYTETTSILSNRDLSSLLATSIVGDEPGQIVLCTAGGTGIGSPCVIWNSSSYRRPNVSSTGNRPNRILDHSHRSRFLLCAGFSGNDSAGSRFVVRAPRKDSRPTSGCTRCFARVSLIRSLVNR